MLVQEARTQRDKFDAVVARVKPVLDCVDLEAVPQPNGRPPRSGTIIQRCKVVWENFKGFNHIAIVTAVTHTLVVVRSHYPVVDLQEIGVGFAEGMGEVEHQQLEDEVEDTAEKASRRHRPVW